MIRLFRYFFARLLQIDKQYKILYVKYKQLEQVCKEQNALLKQCRDHLAEFVHDV